MSPRPILVIDTSVFLKDAFSKTSTGFGTAHSAFVALHAQLTDEIGPDRA